MKIDHMFENIKYNIICLPVVSLVKYILSDFFISTNQPFIKMTTNFSFSYGTLTQRADRADSLMLRDAAQFLSVGYDDVFRTDLKAKVAVFRQLPSDDYWLGQQIIKTERRNQIYSGLVTSMSDLRFRAKLALGEKSAAYRALRFSKLKDIKPEDLIIMANHVKTTCAEMMDELSKRNVTQEMLTELSTQAEELDYAIDEQREIISLREAKAFEREEKANEIYAIIADICEVGKKIWGGVNEVYYNDYVIYGSSEPIEEDEVVTEDPV
jgi:hypothetical protein